MLDRVDDDVLVIVIDRPAQDLPRVGAAGFTGLGVAATRFAAEVMLDQLGLGFDS